MEIQVNTKEGTIQTYTITKKDIEKSSYLKTLFDCDERDKTIISTEYTQNTLDYVFGKTSQIDDLYQIFSACEYFNLKSENILTYIHKIIDNINEYEQSTKIIFDELLEMVR